MDSTIPAFLMRMGLSTTPQTAFDQADALILQAAELREQAAFLKSRIAKLNERADVLTNTAFGLQAIAKQDRESIEYFLERSLEVHKDIVGEYELVPRRAARLNGIRDRVEDGMATVEELEAFLGDIHDFATTERQNRSSAPEPESPPSPTTTRLSIESTQVDFATAPTSTKSLKRKLSAIQEEGDGVNSDGHIQGIKKIKREDRIALERGSDSDSASEGPEQDERSSESPLLSSGPEDVSPNSTTSSISTDAVTTTVVASVAHDYGSIHDAQSLIPSPSSQDTASTNHSSANIVRKEKKKKENGIKETEGSATNKSLDSSISLSTTVIPRRRYRRKRPGRLHDESGI